MLWNFWSDNFKAAWGSARGKIEFVMFCASLLYFFSADWVGDVNWAKVLAWLFVAVFMFEWILIAPFKRYQAMQKQRDDASKLLADTLSSSLPRIAIKKALAQFMEGSGLEIVIMVENQGSGTVVDLQTKFVIQEGTLTKPSGTNKKSHIDPLHKGSSLDFVNPIQVAPDAGGSAFIAFEMRFTDEASRRNLRQCFYFKWGGVKIDGEVTHVQTRLSYLSREEASALEAKLVADGVFTPPSQTPDTEVNPPSPI